MRGKIFALVRIRYGIGEAEPSYPSKRLDALRIALDRGSCGVRPHHSTSTGLLGAAPSSARRFLTALTASITAFISASAASSISDKSASGNGAVMMRLALVRQRLPYLLGDERHDRVQQAQGRLQHVHSSIACACAFASPPARSLGLASSIYQSQNSLHTNS